MKNNIRAMLQDRKPKLVTEVKTELIRAAMFEHEYIDSIQ